MSALLRIAVLLALITFLPHRAAAYIEAPMSLGAVIAQSTNIMTMTVTKVDKEKNLIIFQKTGDIKGKHPTDVSRHNVGRGGLRPGEWEPIMRWAEPGKTAIFFHNGGASETFIVADDEGDPKRLYQRLGFRPVWIQHEFTRRPSATLG